MVFDGGMQCTQRLSLNHVSATGTASGLLGTAGLVRENTLQQGLIISSLYTSERIKTNPVGFHGNSELILVSKLIYSCRRE